MQMNAPSFSRFLLVALISVIAATGCSDSPAGPVGPNPHGDLDSDGIRNALDVCPEDPETLNSWEDEDGCPDSTVELYELARNDVEKFWAGISPSLGRPYTPLHDFVIYPDSVDTACGTVKSQAAYCPPEHGVYLHRSFMDIHLENFGPFAPTFIVAHEVGHGVQWQYGFNPLSVPWTIVRELQADCFAGAYSASSTLRNALGEHDLIENLKEYLVTLYSGGDPSGTSPIDPNAHGTSGQRIDAFKIGYEAGPALCLSETLPFLPLITDQTNLAP